MELPKVSAVMPVPSETKNTVLSVMGIWARRARLERSEMLGPS
jgi:hypothetical protein